MKNTTLIIALLVTLGLAACDRPAVVTVPVTPAVVVPGPAGPTGATGDTGATGYTGATGKSGDGTTIVVTPATPAR